VLYHQNKQYGQGKFNNKPTEEWALKDRIDKLERLVRRYIYVNMMLLRIW